MKWFMLIAALLLGLIVSQSFSQDLPDPPNYISVAEVPEAPAVEMQHHHGVAPVQKVYLQPPAKASTYYGERRLRGRVLRGGLLRGRFSGSCSGFGCGG